MCLNSSKCDPVTLESLVSWFHWLKLKGGEVTMSKLSGSESCSRECSICFKIRFNTKLYVYEVFAPKCLKIVALSNNIKKTLNQQVSEFKARRY